MAARFRYCLRLLLTAIVTMLASYLAPPYIGGVYYTFTGEHDAEQQYLDQAVKHLKLMRAYCKDADLCGILDYTIRRYHKIGAWDVVFLPIIAPPQGKAIGMNCPWCPGVTLDVCLLLDSPNETALVLVHEAMHDYWPYMGHGHIHNREMRLYELDRFVRQYYRPQPYHIRLQGE